MAPTRLRLLHLSPYAVEDPLLGGVPQSVRAVCDALYSSGHEVTIWASDTGDARFAPSGGKEYGMRTRLFHGRLKTLGTALNAPIVPELILLNASMLREFDVVHVHGYWNSFIPSVARVCRRNGIPLVLQPRGSLVRSNQKEELKGVFQFLFRRRIVEATAVAIALTPEERNQLIISGFADSDVRIVPNFVSGPGATLPSSDDARRRLGLPPDTPLVLYLGRLHPSKGLRELVTGFDRVKREIPTAVLAIAGPDDGMLWELRVLIQQLGTQDVFFLGPLGSNDKWIALAAADVLCLPSKFEAFPRVVLEAATAGLPSILSSRVALPQLLEAGGVVSAEPNADQLSTCLVRVLLDPDLRSQVVHNAQRCVEEFFSVRVVVSLLEDAYELAMQKVASSGGSWN